MKKLDHSRMLKAGIHIFLYLAITTAFSQPKDYSSIILGSWIVPESIVKEEIEEPDAANYLKYEFTSQNLLFYSSNEIERGLESSYSIVGDTIKMFDSNWIIQNYSNSELEIMRNFLWMGQIVNSYPIKLIKKTRYDSVLEVYGSPISKLKRRPVFDGGFHLYEYLFSSSTTPEEFIRESQQMALLPHSFDKEDVVIKLNVEINSFGNIKINDVSTVPTLSNKIINNIKAKLENTSGYWIPSPIMENEKSESFNLTFIKRGKTFLKIKAKAAQYFERAKEQYVKAKYLNAIQLITKAINLDAKRYQFYVLRAASYVNLGKVNMYCEDLLKAKQLFPFLNATNTEVIEGKSLEIQCGK